MTAHRPRSSVGHRPRGGRATIAGVSAVAACLCLALAPAAAGEEEIGVGLPAPLFSLKTLNPEIVGTPFVALDDYVGQGAEDPDAKAVLVSFFASWCEPCKRELPFFVELDRAYRAKGLRVLSVDVDRDDDGIEAAKRMAAQAKVVHPVLSDRFRFLSRRYLGDGERAPIPSLFLVRRDGIVLLVERGYFRDPATFLPAEIRAALGIEPDRSSAAGGRAR